MVDEPRAADDIQPENDEVLPAYASGLTEDWWAVILGGAILAVAFTAVYAYGQLEDLPTEYMNPLEEWISKPGKWTDNPAVSLVKDGQYSALLGTIAVCAASLVIFGVGQWGMGESFSRFACGFLAVALLATLAFVMAGQATVKLYHLGYALWAIVLGLLISNTIGTPAFIKPAVKTEFYIKTGLVVLGAEILFGKLLALGKPGIIIAWVVTPIVLTTTYWFGQRILRMASRTLNITIAADMSVCGVSAAIATAAACRAKKEELTLAVGMSMLFTVIMMIIMPVFITTVGIDKTVGAAWMGGTIDATGAVAAAGEFLGDEYTPVAMTVKMIQNILIGVIAFAVSVYWTIYVDRGEKSQKVSLWEIWYRFPKFIVGFVGASVLFSFIHETLPEGPAVLDAMIGGTTKTLRGWFFCLAFVSIGLETNFRELGASLQGGKPLILYVCGQTLNLSLTLLMAWLMFKVVFPEAATALIK
ncbi:hypothetical protein Pan258_33630 [Symmachiella dynata]|uniref:YeiH family protein n=1 Tax=Symmachiella dynata TaxID=2527995 RepID=UPI001189F668|nr:putative sulfate exporter family transporter [Symmachiella dynata]QDT49315.1 hypothetical protein Pan258_33630 [Symmachiella dynata]